MSDYNVGDVITYSPFGGGMRTVKVTAKEADIKNGEPGFDGTIIDGHPDDVGMSVWGYDRQILIVQRAR
jgi:hypothetical protein